MSKKKDSTTDGGSGIILKMFLTLRL